jgi:branched-chain amino acid transport system permease protein
MPQKAKKGFLTSNLWVIIAMAFFAVFPLWSPVIWKHLATEIFIIALFAMSLNLILGRGGLPSFGHACFYCVGGYTTAIFTMKLHFPFSVAILSAPVVAAIFAAVIGFFSVRLTGIHFAILTLGFSQLVWAVAHKWYSFTKGDDGITGIPIPAALGKITTYYYLVFVILIICLILIRAIQNSPFGNTIVGIRENRERVTFSGLKVWHHLWLNFVIAGFFAGLAGSLLAILNRAVFPDFGYWTKSAAAVLMCIFGGVGVFIGPIVGAAAITLLEHYISIYTFYWQLALGCLIIVLVIALPGGISGYIQDRLRQRKEKRITPEVG